MTHAVPGRDQPADTRGTQPTAARATPKPPPRHHLNAASAMALQRQAGNRAVANLVTPAPQETVLQRGILDDVAGVAGDVKGRVLGQFGTWARRIPGYGVLCVALGKDPITQQPVARDATAVVGALVGLVPGGAALWENLQQSGAVARAGEWLSAELPKLGLTWETVRALFSRAWDAVSVTDLIDPSAVWDRLSGLFSDPIGRLRTFASAAGTKLMEFVFEGVLGGAGGVGGQVMGIIHRAGDVIDTIVRNPIGFAGNLVNAVRGGLSQFVTNILTHLRTGLFGWLTGALRGAVQLPQRFDFGGILSMVANMLGLTWPWLRERLVRTLGERTVRLVETGVDWVRDIATRGLAAVSQRLGDMASGFVDTVIGGIRDWVANSIVGAAITRLISMFNPAGAVIQAILAVYNTIRFFIERAQQLGALAESVFGSIAAIASGSLDAAKNAVEQALGRAVPVVLGFLARLMGLGDVAAPVRNILTRIRGAVDGAADRVIGWVSGVARRLTGRGGRAPAAGAQESEAAAVRDATGMLSRPGATASSVRASLVGLRQRHGLRVADLVPGGSPNTFKIHVQRADTDEKSLAPEGATAQGRTLTAYHGARGDKILSIMRDGKLKPSEGAIFLGRNDMSRCFMHGGDTSRHAAFVIELRLSFSGAQVQARTTSTQGVPDTLLLQTNEEVPVEVVTLYVRKPNPDAEEEGGPRFTLETITGAANIRSYLGG